MQTKEIGDNNSVHNCLHDMKSSLQSLMVASELLEEDAALGKQNRVLVNTLIAEVKAIRGHVDALERELWRKGG